MSFWPLTTVCSICHWCFMEPLPATPPVIKKRPRDRSRRGFNLIKNKRNRDRFDTHTKKTRCGHSNCKTETRCDHSNCKTWEDQCDHEHKVTKWPSQSQRRSLFCSWWHDTPMYVVLRPHQQMYTVRISLDCVDDHGVCSICFLHRELWAG